MPARALSAEEASRIANIRHGRKRGALKQHVDVVEKRAAFLTDEERSRLALALVARTRAAQELPPAVTDPAALAAVAAIVAGVARSA